MDNILAVDIGNSTISFGIFQGREQRAEFALPTRKEGLSLFKRSIECALRRAKTKKQTIEHIILCSVVPAMTKRVTKALAEIFKKKIVIAGKHIRVPIKNTYKIPSQAGIDRLLAAFAALKRYGPGLIIVDFGTAVTFDVVSKKSEYLGGMIFPGFDLSLDALAHHTALLPRIVLTSPRGLVGKDTVSGINAGIVFGMTGACDAIITRLQKQFRGYKVIATGGTVGFIRHYSQKITTIHRSLVLEGLARLLTS